MSGKIKFQLIMVLALLLASYQNCGQMNAIDRLESSSKSGDTNSSGPTNPDTGPPPIKPEQPPVLGSKYQPSRGPLFDPSNEVLVKNVSQLLEAIQNATPGQAITLLPGSYNINSTVHISKSGTSSKPIFLRARSPGMAILKSCTIESIKLTGKHWIFENLQMTGSACTSKSEHAFHIVYPADSIILRDNDIVDYATHVKTNGVVIENHAQFPNHIWFIGNKFHRTKNASRSPVNILNLDGGTGYIIRDNTFSGMLRSGTGRASGIYIKTEIEDTMIEQNLIVCKKSGKASNTVSGINIGEGTGQQYCPQCNSQRGQSIRTTIRNNIIMNCQGSGNSNAITVEKDEHSMIYHNSIFDSKNIFFSGLYEGNANTLFQSNIIQGSINDTYRSSMREVPNSEQNHDIDNLYMESSDYFDIFNSIMSADWTLLEPSRIKNKGKKFLHNTGVGAKEVRVDWDYCGNQRDSQPDLGAIEYGENTQACIDKIKTLYNKL